LLRRLRGLLLVLRLLIGLLLLLRGLLLLEKRGEFGHAAGSLPFGHAFGPNEGVGRHAETLEALHVERAARLILCVEKEILFHSQKFRRCLDVGNA